MRYRKPVLDDLSRVNIEACTHLDTQLTSQPIAPVRDYETILVGNLEANYIGDENCLAKCHIHDRIASDFKHSIHGDQISEETGLPLVNCESCHGPGSMAVENITAEQRCDFNTLLTIVEFPAKAHSMLCLRCLSADSTPNLHSWNSIMHALKDVS